MLQKAGKIIHIELAKLAWCVPVSALFSFYLCKLVLFDKKNMIQCYCCDFSFTGKLSHHLHYCFHAHCDRNCVPLMDWYAASVAPSLNRPDSLCHTDPTEQDLQLTKDEHNTLRYACGCVAVKLQLEFLKLPGNLDCMEVEISTSSLLAYTREWVDRINRGGLFDISDESYYQFVAIKLSMRSKLMDHLKKYHLTENSWRKVRVFSTSDSDVQFHWSIQSVDIEDEEDIVMSY